MKKVLMKGNEAMGRAAIEAGCRFYAGYPITPQNELPEYMSRELPKCGGVFVQGESELASINMLYGACAAGFRGMVSSSSPGISLMQEGLSFISRAEIPALVVDVVRGGPGIGSIQPSQCDYKMATRGGGNGDYHIPVLAPSNLQEAVDLIMEGFDIADYYRNPVIILADGLIGQMMEPVSFEYKPTRKLKEKDWALIGAATGNGNERKRHVISSFNLNEYDCEQVNLHLNEKYKQMEETEQRWEELFMDDAEYAFVAYGTAARIAKTAVNELRKQGHKIGLLRPITLWPFPEKAFEGKENIKKFLTVEFSLGQMIDDVKIACNDKRKVKFYGRCGGVMFSPEEIIEFALKEMEVC